MKKIKELLAVFLVVSFLGFLGAKDVQAGTLTGAKDTITNSRPSALSSLAVGASAGDAYLLIGNAIDTNNRAKFIASDSAKLVGGPGETELVTVASMSAVAGNSAAVYLATTPAGNHNVGTTVMYRSTARHTISFRTVNVIPNSGDIQIIFPAGNSTNPDFPSTSGFSFNQLTSANATSHISTTFEPSGPTCDSWTVTPASGLIQCNLGTGITGPTTVTVNIGISVTNPVLINPAKSAAQGSDDSWTVTLRTRDDSDEEIDTAKISTATIEAVEVYATVDPFIDITIAGMSNGGALGVGSTTCALDETINTGFDSSATRVDLGVLGSGQINYSGQKISVSTNAINGYTLTATSSGHLIDPAIGYWIADAQGTPTDNNTPEPAVITTNALQFGIHPCGQDVTTATWGAENCTIGTNCEFANPSATYYYTLASDDSGPIDSSDGDDGITNIVYAASITAQAPAGNYRTAITYIATPTF
jgi:hypothetical protein